MATDDLRPPATIRESRHVERTELLWDDFDVPVCEEEDVIETGWLHFAAGHSRTDIWHWFEHTLGVSVAHLTGHNEPPIVQKSLTERAMQRSETLLGQLTHDRAPA